MNRTDTFLIGVSLFIFLASPYLPTVFYKMAFTNMIVPFLLLVLVLLLVKSNPIGSVTVLLAIMSLFIEYRYRVLATSVPRSAEPPAEYEKQLAAAPPIMPDELHPPPRQPNDKRVTYKPTEDATDEFEAVGRSVNGKKALPGVRLPEETNQYLIEHGLGALNQ
jgi:hypothetical protein